MSTYNNQPDRYQHFSIVVGLVMLALLVPLTVFVSQKENETRSHASTVIPSNAANPTFGALGPCVGCQSAGISPVVGGVSITPATVTIPPAPSVAPCTASVADSAASQAPSTSPSSVPSSSPSSAPIISSAPSVSSTPNQNGKKKKSTNKPQKQKHSKHKQHNGAISKGIDGIIQLFIALLKLLLQLIGGQSPTPQPAPTPQPCAPTPQMSVSPSVSAMPYPSSVIPSPVISQ